MDYISKRPKLLSKDSVGALLNSKSVFASRLAILSPANDNANGGSTSEEENGLTAQQFDSKVSCFASSQKLIN